MTLRGEHTHTHTLHRLGSNLENFPQTSTNSDKCRKGPSRHIDLFPRSRSERQIQTLLFCSGRAHALLRLLLQAARGRRRRPFSRVGSRVTRTVKPHPEQPGPVDGSVPRLLGPSILTKPLPPNLTAHLTKYSHHPNLISYLPLLVWYIGMCMIL